MKKLHFYQFFCKIYRYCKKKLKCIALNLGKKNYNYNILYMYFQNVEIRKQDFSKLDWW